MDAGLRLPPGRGTAACRGGRVIRRILRSRLPDRFARQVPRPLVELAIGLAVGVLFALARVPLQPILADQSPYAGNFVAVVVAAVLGGWRSGLIALATAQLITATAVVPFAGSLLDDSDWVGGFVFATLSQLLMLAVIALYQREVSKAMAEQGRQMDLQSDALREIDHRTRNNYQTVVALILLQAQKAENPDVRRALAEAADRVRAVSLASDQLALRSEGLGTVRLGDHLRELCQQLKRGLAGDEVLLHCDAAEVTARADTAIHLSIVVNELVTNALKHAFDKSHANKEIRVSCAAAGDGIELVISDNGKGIRNGARKRNGLGTRLVERFVEELGARYEIASSSGGTTHRIRLETVA
jgi:two-component sensor histidine kinase